MTLDADQISPQILGMRTEPVSRFERREAQVLRILEGARACFLKSGFQGASMGDICAAAGMSPGALYRYFPSKESLIEAICSLNRDDDAVILAGITNAPSIVDGMTEGFMAHAKQVNENGMAPLFAEIFSASQRNPVLKQTMERSMAEVYGIVSSAIQAAIDRKEINPILPLDQLMPITMAMCDGLVTSDLPKSGIPIEAMEPAVRALIVGVLRPTTLNFMQAPSNNHT